PKGSKGLLLLGLFLCFFTVIFSPWIITSFNTSPSDISRRFLIGCFLKDCCFFNQRKKLVGNVPAVGNSNKLYENSFLIKLHLNAELLNNQT
ncbi:hypothetical protein, partial [Niallia circulans]|uniref:hypothetical protein n=1 Tax=Niallia circulans TaxID=1397 RepID=UPI001CFF9B67